VLVKDLWGNKWVVRVNAENIMEAKEIAKKEIDNVVKIERCKRILNDKGVSIWNG